jgi:hypothetical protein
MTRTNAFEQMATTVSKLGDECFRDFHQKFDQHQILTNLGHVNDQE